MCPNGTLTLKESVSSKTVSSVECGWVAALKPEGRPLAYIGSSQRRQKCLGVDKKALLGKRSTIFKPKTLPIWDRIARIDQFSEFRRLALEAIFPLGKRERVTRLELATSSL